MKKLLASEPRALAHGMASELLSYAIGRPMTFSDQDEIETIVDGLEPHGLRLRHLLHEVVRSPLFREP